VAAGSAGGDSGIRIALWASRTIQPIGGCRAS
jgi:hypothetical protein